VEFGADPNRMEKGNSAFVDEEYDSGAAAPRATAGAGSLSRKLRLVASALGTLGEGLTTLPPECSSRWTILRERTLRPRSGPPELSIYTGLSNTGFEQYGFDCILHGWLHHVSTKCRGLTHAMTAFGRA
jgi:hypothetical protein